MSKNTPDNFLNNRVEREVERERHERVLNDEQRAGLAADAEFRLKDARENAGSGTLRRSAWR